MARMVAIACQRSPVAMPPRTMRELAGVPPLRPRASALTKSGAPIIAPVAAAVVFKNCRRVGLGWAPFSIRACEVFETFLGRWYSDMTCSFRSRVGLREGEGLQVGEFPLSA